MLTGEGHGSRCTEIETNNYKKIKRKQVKSQINKKFSRIDFDFKIDF
jgi:hypothetical protein